MKISTNKKEEITSLKSKIELLQKELEYKDRLLNSMDRRAARDFELIMDQRDEIV